MDHENCRDSAVCKLCFERTKDKEKSTILRNNNTSTLWRHLENGHKREYKIINDIQTKNKQEKYNQKNKEDKVEVIVTDNASNITNGVEFSEHKSIRCAAHTLQLAVNDCLEDKKIKDLLKKCRAIVTLFRQSTKLNEKLKKKQEKTNLNELKLIQDV